MSTPTPDGKPVLMLGTATFGAQCDEQSSRDIIDRAIENGMQWLDTATSYPLGSGPETVGATEEIIGRAVEGRRDEVRIATKIYNRTGPGEWQLGLSRRHIVEAIEGSLRRLRTDHVDLLQLHRFDANTPVDETLAALGDALAAGKVAAVGCCNFDAAQLNAYLSAGQATGNDALPALRTAQTRYSLVRRGAENALIPLAMKNGVGILAFNVLAGGLLTGKYQRDSQPVDSVRFGDSAAGERYRQRYWTDSVFDGIDAVRAIANDLGVPMSALATAWVLHQRGVAGLLVGVTRIGHLEDAFHAASMTLSTDVLAALDAATAAQRVEVDEIAFESS